MVCLNECVAYAWMVCFFPDKILPKESFLRLWGGSSIIRLRSPRSFRSTGFSHTDKCIVGLKKNTLSSPVHTTHLQNEKERCIYTFAYTLKHNPTGCLWYSHYMTKKSRWRKTFPAAPKWPRERILGHNQQLRTTKTRWAEFDRLIQFLIYFCLIHFSVIFLQQVHKILKWINPQYVQHQVSTSLLYI